MNKSFMPFDVYDSISEPYLRDLLVACGGKDVLPPELPKETSAGDWMRTWLIAHQGPVSDQIRVVTHALFDVWSAADAPVRLVDALNKARLTPPSYPDGRALTLQDLSVWVCLHAPEIWRRELNRAQKLRLQGAPAQTVRVVTQDGWPIQGLDAFKQALREYLLKTLNFGECVEIREGEKNVTWTLWGVQLKPYPNLVSQYVAPDKIGLAENHIPEEMEFRYLPVNGLLRLKARLPRKYSLAILEIFARTMLGRTIATECGGFDLFSFLKGTSLVENLPHGIVRARIAAIRYVVERGSTIDSFLYEASEGNAEERVSELIAATQMGKCTVQEILLAVTLDGAVCGHPGKSLGPFHVHVDANDYSFRYTRAEVVQLLAAWLESLRKGPMHDERT